MHVHPREPRHESMGPTAVARTVLAIRDAVPNLPVGVITGELELRTVLAEDGSTVRTEVRYEGADEWYALTGGSCALKDPEDLSAVHELLVGVLNRPEG